VVLRNYEGYITTYEEPLAYEQHDRSACRYCQSPRPEPGQSGVLGLLEGERMWIEPRGFADIHTRGNLEAHRLQDPAKWVPFGVGAIEGQAGRPLRDGFLIRRTATERRIPVYTSLDTLKAALDGSASERTQTVRTVDEYRGAKLAELLVPQVPT